MTTRLTICEYYQVFEHEAAVFLVVLDLPLGAPGLELQRLVLLGQPVREVAQPLELGGQIRTASRPREEGPLKRLAGVSSRAEKGGALD